MATRFLLATTIALPALALSAELPVPCASGSCGAISTFVTSGIASATVNGNILNVDQASSSALLNWQSFNVSADGTVNFNQPDSGSIAINRIYQSDPARIFGALNANGRVYLLNQNGFLFGSSSRVNVSGLVASSLDLSASALEDGLAAAALQNQPAFAAYANGLPSGAIEVASGARISTPEGGQVLVFAPTINNAGTVATPGGQTILAAGSTIYLASSSDDNLRGLLVEVGGTGGTITNGTAGNAGVTDPLQLAGQIIAERGNVTLAGLAVNQLGRVSATTAVQVGGSIILQGRDNGSAQAGSQTAQLLRGSGGEVRLGQNSVTEVTLDTSGETAVDVNEQPVSAVSLDARLIELDRNARIIAPHGNVTLIAREDSQTEPGSFFSDPGATGRIHLAAGATIDVSGARIERGIESVVIDAELRGSELADSPEQREGALRSETVRIDTRQSGTREDGSTWVGSPIGDLSGWVSAVGRDVQERSLTGGRVTLQATGDIVLAEDSRIDLSGGAISYADGYLDTSALIGVDGKLYDVGSADRERAYVGVAQGSAYTLTDDRWGVTRTFSLLDPRGRFEAGYTEGKDAGTLSLLGQRIVLDGDIVAATERSRYQRQTPAALSASSLYRPYDQMALSGALSLGQFAGVTGSNGYADYMVEAIEFTAAGTAPVLPAGFTFGDTLPEAAATVRLPVDLLGEDRIGRLDVRATSEITLAGDLAVSMPVEGSLGLRAGRIDIVGTIAAPSGSVSLTSAPTASFEPLSDDGGVYVRAGALIDVSGNWVNDRPAVNGGLTAGTAPLGINGGSVSLTGSQSNLTVEAGSLVNASGGGHILANNSLEAGRGGTISLSATPDPVTTGAPHVQIEGDLRAFAFYDGGHLSIATAALCIAPATADCIDDGRTGLVRLAPESFGAGGFASYTLSSQNGGIEIPAGASILLQQSNWVAANDLTSLSTGSSLAETLTTGLLDAALRNPTNLTLTVNSALPFGSLYDVGAFATAPSLIVGQGARVQAADAGAAITLSSSTRLLVDGTIEAPAGRISLNLTSDLVLAERDSYFRDQGIVLGSSSQLLAPGASRLITNANLGRISGEVLDGGSVSLVATRGHVLAESGSVIDVSGTVAELDIRADSFSRYQRRSIGSDAGSITVQGAEAVLLGSTLRAAGGKPGVNRGGSLSLALDASGRQDPGQVQQVPTSELPDGSRVIELVQNAAVYDFADATLPDEFNNRGILSVDQVTRAGIDVLSLRAVSLLVQVGLDISVRPGQIQFRGDIDLALARSLTLNAAIIASDGGRATAAATYIAFGHADPLYQQAAPSVLGLGTLQLQAGLLDVTGTTALQGLETLTLAASGDLRFSAVQQGNSVTQAISVEGALAVPGNLVLEAAQIYPTTLSTFTLQAGQANGGSITITRPADAEEAAVLSAGGRLILNAPSIVHMGTLRAPFGSLEFDAASITLGAGSVTSTSGAGLVIPFGSTQGGFDWTYTLTNNAGTWTLVYGSDGRTLPSQQMIFDAAEVDIAEGATIDVRGGGELVASEFVSGPTGSADYLSAEFDPTRFAILPATQLAAMPFDPQLQQGSTLAPGTSVHLDGVGDLPSGDYIIMPARYAVLPGAYLVSPVEGYGDIVAGEQYSQLDGSVVVAGYFTGTGTSLRDERTSGFAILSGDLVQERARYDLTYANDFFTAQAELAGLSAFRLPFDAGTLAILTDTSLTLDGTFLAAAATGGRGAALDIAGDTITIVADAASGGAGLVIEAGNLSAFGAESILIGGTRSEGVDGVAIDTRASLVSIEAGAELSAPELILVAEDLQVGTGAVLAALEREDLRVRDLELSGDGAVIRVSAGDVVDVARSGGTAGQLVIEAGSLLSAAGGSINVESANLASFAGELQAAGGALSITGGQISVTGATPVNAAGIVLSGAALAAVNLETLVLSSRGALDIYDGAALSGSNISLVAEAVRGQGGSASVEAAGVLSLSGVPDGSGTVPASLFAGDLTLEGASILVEGGTLAFSGFSRVDLTAAREFRAAADSSLAFDSAVNIDASQLNAASGVDLALTSAGAISVGTPTVIVEVPVRDDLGGNISFSGSTVAIDSAIVLASGRLQVASTAATNGGVQFGSQAEIDLAGRTTSFDGDAIGSGGGSLIASTRSGNIDFSPGTFVDVSGAGEAAAGSISLTAVAGTVTATGQLRGSSATTGGSFSIDAAEVAGLAGLDPLLETGGFTGARSYRQRGPGDLTVEAGQLIRAADIRLVADQGRVVVDGTLRAEAALGGRVLVAGRDGIAIAGTIDARAANSASRNGRIDLQVSEGGLSVATSAVIATTSSSAAQGSAADGQLRIRLPQSELLALLDADATNDRISLAGEWAANRVSIEGFRAYSEADGILTTADVATSSAYFTDASAFAAQAGALTPLLSQAGVADTEVLAGVEIRSTGDLTLGNSWDLSEWRFNGDPGLLTLRAEGNLIFNASLSDGFNGVTGTSAFLLTRTDESWSYRLVAGADATSADILAVQPLDALASDSGNLRITAGNVSSTNTYRFVRTGTGSIDARAARNFELGNAASTLYTAGIAQSGTVFSFPVGELGGRQYPGRGGDISIVAGGDVIGAATTQLVNDWLWRVGTTTSGSLNRSTAWTVNFGRFQQNVGALAGGDVRVVAGGNVDTLSVSTATIGWQTGGTTPETGNLQVIGGGNLLVRSGQDVLGGSYYSGRGTIDIDAFGAIGTSTRTNLAPILALGETQAALRARQGVRLETAVNPTWLPQGTSQGASLGGLQSVFSTYTAATTLELQSLTGDVELSNDGARIQSALTSMNWSSVNPQAALRIYPSTLTAVALRGDIEVERNFTLFPDANGSLSLLADQNVSFANNVSVIVSDVDPAYLPSQATPRSGYPLNFEPIMSFPYTSAVEFNAAVPVRAAASQAGTLPYSRIVANTGDVIMNGGSQNTLYFGGPVTVRAGRDVVDIDLQAQNLSARDLTSISAGRDIRYSISRNLQGFVSPSDFEIRVDGPGQLALTAGRNLTLQNSDGISTQGNLNNPALASSGASISVLAGLNGEAPDYAAFQEVYLRDSRVYDAALIAYVALVTGTTPADAADALVRFDGLRPSQREVFLQAVFFAELRASGRYAADPDPLKFEDYSAGYRAIETLFPGGNPEVGEDQSPLASEGSSNPYAGDVALYFSRIYTLDGGDISLLAPGGGVNAGLATPPSAFGIAKEASELGIVAQGTGNVSIYTYDDLAVNESRVFAADGGSILVWANQGDIDAGRGEKTAISAPPPTITFDPDGRVIVEFGAALTGSGIQALATSEGTEPGDVDLYAPRGVVNAGDAGIVAGNLTIGATAVLGADNISVSGVAVGVPVDTGGLGASLAGVSSSASSASNAAAGAVADPREGGQGATPLAEAALSFLEVFVIGLGDENCRPDDLECLERQGSAEQ